MKALLFIALIIILSASVLADNVYIIAGEITETGDINLDPLYLLGPASEYEKDISSGSYLAEFYYQEQIIKTFYFDVSEDGGNLYFMFSTEIPGNTGKIVFKNNNEMIYELIKTNPPVVNYVDIREQENGYLIQWLADDVDNDKLFYSIYYSNAGGNWTPLALDIIENEFLLDSSLLPGGQTAIKIQASDGFNIAEKISDSFSVSGKAPFVSIILPEDNSEFFDYESISLEGYAYDLEDGEIDGLWKLDGSLIGEGEVIILENLNYGSYLIELSATDSDGNEGSDGVEISVESNLSSNNAPILAPIGNQSVVVGGLIGFSVTASDEDNDTLTFTNPLANELPQGASFNTTLNEQGVIEGLFSWTPTNEQIANYQVNFIVSDGELNDSETINIEVVAPLPYIQSLSPTKGQVGSYLWISGKDFGVKNEVSQVEFSNSNTTAFAQIYYWYNNYILVYIPELALGIYKITIINQEGRSNSLDFTVISLPSLTITSPQANSNVSDTGFNFIGTAEDDNGIAEVRVYVYDYGRRAYTVSNALTNYNSNTNIWNFQVLSSYITTGKQAMLLARAKDTEGNWNYWQNIVVNVVDITPPSLTITSPQANSVVPRAGFNFTGTVEDISGVAEVRVYVYDYGKRTYTVMNSLANYNPGTNIWSFEVLSSYITQGQQAILWARAKDTKGNWNSWKYVIVNVA